MLSCFKNWCTGGIYAYTLSCMWSTSRSKSGGSIQLVQVHSHIQLVILKMSLEIMLQDPMRVYLNLFPIRVSVT